MGVKENRDVVSKIIAALNETQAYQESVIRDEVDDWLVDHPEATTTVTDGSVTLAKLASDIDGAFVNYKWHPNLAISPETLPYNVTFTNSSNTSGIWKSLDYHAGNAFPVKAGKYYLQIFSYGYGDGDTTGTYSAVTMRRICNGSWQEIGTAIGNFGYVGKNRVGSSIFTNVYITRIDSDYATARISVTDEGMGTTEHTVDINVYQSLVLEFDTAEEAFACSYHVYGFNNTFNYDGSGIGVFVESFPSDIIYWGDSLTAGAGGEGTSFPGVCSYELGITGLNCGVGGESANTIAARQGGNNVIIPAGAINGTYSTLTDIFGAEIAPLVQGDGQLSASRIFINGQFCTISRSNNVYTISGYTGGSSAMPLIGTFSGSMFRAGIVVIFVGANGASVGGSTDINALISVIDSMIKHIGHDRYVVFTKWVTNGTETGLAADDAAMLKHYGNKLFPMRKMLVNYGLDLMGITPTEQDTTDIAAGTIPSSLRSDSVHLNADGYTAVGKFLADKIRSLGYMTERG